MRPRQQYTYYREKQESRIGFFSSLNVLLEILYKDIPAQYFKQFSNPIMVFSFIDKPANNEMTKQNLMAKKLACSISITAHKPQSINTIMVGKALSSICHKKCFLCCAIFERLQFIHFLVEASDLQCHRNLMY
jgi:hypothetical protein